jgi:hypothetical protein
MKQRTEDRGQRTENGERWTVDQGVLKSIRSLKIHFVTGYHPIHLSTVHCPPSTVLKHFRNYKEEIKRFYIYGSDSDWQKQQFNNKENQNTCNKDSSQKSGDHKEFFVLLSLRTGDYHMKPFLFALLTSGFQIAQSSFALLNRRIAS